MTPLARRRMRRWMHSELAIDLVVGSVLAMLVLALLRLGLGAW